VATLLNSSVLEVYGWQLNPAIELGSADLWETKAVNEKRNRMMEEWSYILLVEAESDHNVMAPVPQAVCLQPGVREQMVLAGTDVRVNMPAAVSSLLLRTWMSVITFLDHST
jgi:hypothetical protein